MGTLPISTIQPSPDVIMCIIYCMILIVGGAAVGGLLFYAISVIKGCWNPEPAITVVDQYLTIAFFVSAFFMGCKVWGNRQVLIDAAWLSLMVCVATLACLTGEVDRKIFDFRRQQAERDAEKLKSEEILRHVDWWP